MRVLSCFCPRASLRCSKNTRRHGTTARLSSQLVAGKKNNLVESEIEDEMLVMMMMIGMIGEVRQCLYMMMMRMIVFPKGRKKC